MRSKLQAKPAMVSATPQPALPPGLESANVFRDKFGKLSDEQWLDVLLQAYDETTIDGVRFPQYPNAELQNRIHGYSNQFAMREAFEFYHFIKNHDYIRRKFDKESFFLDFAAGWGRMSRLFLRDFDLSNIYGYEPNFAFCVIARTLNPYMCFLRGGYSPDNILPRNRFDLVIGYSIFSHLSESAAVLWLKEMARVTRPDAYCVFTTWGDRFLSRLIAERGDLARGKEIHWYSRTCLAAAGDIEEQQRRYRQGEFIWFDTNGGPYGEAFLHPNALVSLLQRHEIPFELVEFDQSLLAQDAFILRRTETDLCTAELIEPVMFSNPDELAREAWLAMDRSDWDDAIGRWEVVRANAPDRADGYIAACHALRSVGRVDEAEAMGVEAIARFPQSADALTAHAWVAMQRQDWDEAVRRWQLAREQFPERADVYVWPALALRQANRFGEAEAMSAEALARYPEDPDVLTEHAGQAMARWDWEEAVCRWQAARERRPDHAETYVWPIRALRMLQRLDEADALASDALARFPGNTIAMVEQILIAVDRGDWDQASAHMAASRSQLLVNWRIHPELSWVDYRLQLKALARKTANGPRAERVATTEAFRAELPVSELMLCFESLGRRCDLGAAQTAYGAEPLGLLRFADVPFESLTAALDSRFEGLGSKDDTVFCRAGSEYMITSRRYLITFHTYVYDKDLPTPEDRERFFAQHRRRLGFLKDKLISDLESAEKIFVYSNYEHLSETEIERLFGGLRRYGANRLLCVRPADIGHPDGTIETPQDGLFIGYLGLFPDFRADEPLPDESWRTLCEKTYRLARQQGFCQSLPVSVRDGFIRDGSAPRRAEYMSETEGRG